MSSTAHAWAETPMSNSLTISRFMRAVYGQWMRRRLSPWAYSRTVDDSGVTAGVRREKTLSLGRLANR